jgi:hypothetical protein
VRPGERTLAQPTAARLSNLLFVSLAGLPRLAVVASSFSAALVVERGAFVLPFVPHSAEDRACVEADTEADEEGDQRYDYAGGAVALLP